MRLITTLSNISRADAEKTGYRASDLAVLKEKGFNIPLSFVVNSEAFEEFMAENGLPAKIEAINAEKPDAQAAYDEIIALFASSKLPKDLLTELKEAYESLSVELGGSANSIIQGYDAAFATLIRSPTYLLHTEDEEGILQNIKGFEQLAIGLKLIWSTAFSPDSKSYRQKSGIEERFGMGVIVQKMKKVAASALVYSRTEFNEYMIRVKSFKGLLDYSEPIGGKDVHEVDLNSLLIRNSQINTQEYEITQDLETDELVKRPVLHSGSGQKLNDKVISECARIAKKAKSFIGKDIKLYLEIQADAISILQVNRMIIEERKEVLETEEIEVLASEDGSTVIEEKEEIRIKIAETPSKLTMPILMSLDEAKEHAVKDLGHKLFSLDGFSEETTPNSEVIPADNSQAAVNAEIKKEEGLLEEVLRLKEILDKMEAHAHSDNKEAYEHEVRKLRVLLDSVRKESE